MQTEPLASYPGRVIELVGSGATGGAGASSSLTINDLDHVRAKLKEVARNQEVLSHVREGLLLERSKLRSSAYGVREQRIAAGDAEVQFMNILRDFYRRNGETFPQALEVAYERVVEERDALGSLEEEYLQAERASSGSEWNFIEKERVFYQYELQDIVTDGERNDTQHDLPTELTRLPPLLSPLPSPPPPPPPLLPVNTILIHGAPPPPPPPPPSPPIYLPPRSTFLTSQKTHPHPPPSTRLPVAGTVHQQYREALSELDSLRRTFNLLRSRQSQLLDVSPRRNMKRPHATLDLPDSQDFYETYSELLDNIADCEVKVQHLKQEDMQYENLNTLLSRRMSDPISTEKRCSSSINIITRAHTDGVLHTVLDNPNMKLRIRDWLLDYMKNNTIERTMYFNILAAHGISVSDINSLEECAEHYWPLDRSDQSPDTLDEPAELDEPELASVPSQYPNQHHEVPSSARTEAMSAFDVEPFGTYSSHETELSQKPLQNSLAQVAPSICDDPLLGLGLERVDTNNAQANPPTPYVMSLPALPPSDERQNCANCTHCSDIADPPHEYDPSTNALHDGCDKGASPFTMRDISTAVRRPDDDRSENGTPSPSEFAFLTYATH